MINFNYIIWNPNQAIFHLGSFAVRWYGLGIAMAFLGGSQLIKYVYQKEGRPLEDAERFSIRTLFSALVGARLGEIIFYDDFRYYLRHPLEALLPITFDPHFKFTGYQGFSYHGAIIGTLLGTYIYANYYTKLQLSPLRLRIKRQNRIRQSFLWLSTPLALAMTMGFLVRIGNFVNSEITGTPTQSSYGVLFANNVVTQLQHSSEAIAQVKIRKTNTSATRQAYQPVLLEITFKNGGYEERVIRNFLEKRIKYYLATNSLITKHLYEASEQPLDYTLSKTRRNAYVAQIQTQGIPRHPVQLYESMAYLITLLVHLYWWGKRHKTLASGTLAGSIIIFCYGFRFIGEFFKEPFNILFEGYFTLTMGHLLSLLTVLVGIGILIYSRVVSTKEGKKKAEA